MSAASGIAAGAPAMTAARYDRVRSIKQPRLQAEAAGAPPAAAVGAPFSVAGPPPQAAIERLNKIDTPVATGDLIGISVGLR